MSQKPCLFCRKRTTPKVNVRVIPEALGGCLMLPDEVCFDCQARFSSLDAALVRKVLATWGREPHTTEDPAANRPGAVERALAKSAFLFACKALGPRKARLSPFTHIQKFVTREFQANPGLVEIYSPDAVQDRHRSLERYVKPNCHTVILDVKGAKPVVEFIFGQKPFGRVLLTLKHTNEVRPRDHAVALFDHTTGECQFLTYRDDLEKLTALFLPDHMDHTELRV